MFHLLKLIHKDKDTHDMKKLLNFIPAIGISFPDGNYTKSVKVAVNKPWLQQDFFDNFDNSEEEEEYET